jgi:hypothetical protein
MDIGPTTKIISGPLFNAFILPDNKRFYRTIKIGLKYTPHPIRGDVCANSNPP